MHVAFDVPDAVGKSATTSACHLLLLETPVGQFNLVRKKHTASHDVHEPELRLNGADALLGFCSVGVGLDNLNLKHVVCIAFESLVTISRDFILPIGLCDGGADIVGVQAAIGGEMVELDDRTIFNKDGTHLVPGLGAREVGAIVVFWHDWQGLIFHDPDVVLVLVGVQSDLLLLAATRVHVAVGV
jgi:hypothetical protein